MKTNKEKNLAHDAKMQERMRPKQTDYNYKPLEDAIRAMILNSKVNEQARVSCSPVGSI